MTTTVDSGRLPRSGGRGFFTRRAHQGGVVLIIALILMIVIGISSALAMRSALFGDLVSHNMRAQNLAFQAAEIALRWCENQVLAPPVGFNVLDLGDPTPAVNNEWQVEANWAAPNAVPGAVLGDVVDYETPPDCIVRRMTYNEAYGNVDFPPDALRPEDRGISPDFLFFFRVTARGYSPDYEVDGDGNPVSGAEVRLQSMLRGLL